MAVLPAVGSFPWAVADTGNSQVKTFTTTPTPVVIMQGVAATALARDNAGNIYAATSTGIFKWTAATQLTTQILLTGATGIVVDTVGDLYRGHPEIQHGAALGQPGVKLLDRGATPFLV